MPKHEYLAGGTSDTKTQEILGSLVQGRCKVLSPPATVTQLEIVSIKRSEYKNSVSFTCGTTVLQKQDKEMHDWKIRKLTLSVP